MDILACLNYFNYNLFEKFIIINGNSEENIYKIRPLILPINDILKFIPSKSSILDLGCGKGLLVDHIQNFKFYTGVDLNVKHENVSQNINL